ncbi:MAG: phosphodiester glycosidase family protein [Oscillibacter sp.]|nr:phosphodiester glycosidase family protein [uncultured Oscillibacter sp.]MCI8970428.1 phosphodiester glycosidase family protein [Oscillibacter sp.]
MNEETRFSSRRGWWAAAAAAALLAAAYLLFAFSGIPLIAKWRTLYIETAMGTMSHQWLATAFLPDSVIQAAMKDVEARFQDNLIEASGIAQPGPSAAPEFSGTPEERAVAEFSALFPEVDLDTLPESVTWEDLPTLEMEHMEGVYTTAGDKVWAIDVPNKILICTVSGEGYQGKLAIAKDSSQVILAKNTLSGRGQTVTELCEAYGGVLGVNASGFYDPEGKGRGNVPMGFVLSGGEYSGQALKGRYQTAGFDYEDNFRAGRGLDLEEMRDAVQFYPILVLNGEKRIDGSFGMGIQPRTVIGQTADKATLLLVIDGRRVGHSLGTTVSECADILLRYGCWTAMNMDGGSSSSMTFNGRIITKTSSSMTQGRYLPDAWVVKGIPFINVLS